MKRSLIAAFCMLTVWSGASSAAPSSAAYLLSPGDVVMVSVWQEDSLRQEATVLPDGSITFPLAGRIVGLVDVFDALTSDRPYKSAWSVTDAAAVIRKERGAHFDPRLVDLFLDDFDAFLRIYEQHKDGAPGNGSTLALLEEIQHRVQAEEPQP